LSHASFEFASTQLKTACPDSKGHVKSFIYDPTDLASIKIAVDSFLEEEWRLDVLFLDTNDTDTNNFLRSFFLAKLLLPILHTTASHFCHPNPSIRVVWISSSHGDAEQVYLLAHEFSQRKHDGQVPDAHAHTLPNSNPLGVQHVFVDQRGSGSNLHRSIRRLKPSLAGESEYELCTLLYTGLAGDVRSRDWVVPWGRKDDVPEHVRECISIGERK
jgi:retinol dehydrogenase-12